jgi:hypothetical protein
MSKKKLFISHATKDKALAKSLVEMLVTVTPLSRSDIGYYSTAPGGEDIVQYLHTRIQKPEAVIVLLSANYFSSAYSLCELGAGCAVSQHIYPLLVPPLTEQKLQSVLALKGVMRIDNTDDLNSFITQLQKQLELGELNLPRWAMSKKNFLASLPSHLN